MGIQTDHRGRGWGIGKWVVFRGCLENGRMGWQHVASVHHGSCLYCWYSGRDRHVANIYWMKYNPDIPAPQPPSVGKNDVLTREDIWCQALRVLVINPKITHALITILDISFKPVNASRYSESPNQCIPIFLVTKLWPLFSHSEEAVDIFLRKFYIVW